MDETLRAFGRGVVKLLISLFVGAGAGLMTFGIAAMGKPSIWIQREPPGEMFLGIGVGFLSTGLLMLVLFFIPGLWKAQPRKEPGDGKHRSDTTPRNAERHEKGSFQLQE